MGWYKEVKELYLDIPAYERTELLKALCLEYLHGYFLSEEERRDCKTAIKNFEGEKPSDYDWLLLLKVAIALGRMKIYKCGG